MKACVRSLFVQTGGAPAAPGVAPGRPADRRRDDRETDAAPAPFVLRATAGFIAAKKHRGHPVALARNAVGALGIGLVPRLIANRHARQSPTVWAPSDRIAEGHQGQRRGTVRPRTAYDGAAAGLGKRRASCLGAA